jgi:WD40 repeat protein/tRNA A-37 threonylcarbamoyl transferase component Bud32
VYLAFDPVLDREVAIKVPRHGAQLSQQERERFLREAKAAGKLRHPNIVPVYDAGNDDGQLFIASAFIAGETLERRLEQGRLEFAGAAELVVALAEALEYAHGQDTIHRDVKPANIMLDAKGAPLLMDFGLAQLREAEDRLTHDGTVLGTPAYMAPEQAAARANEVGAASDQYSLGVVLYELLCGERPFEGPPALVISMVINQEPPSPMTHNSAIPRDLETICLKAMAKSPQHRYGNCQQLADDLRRWLNHEPIRARRVSLPERLVRWCRREPVIAGLVCTVAIVTAIGFSAVLWQWSKAAQERREAIAQRDKAFRAAYLHRMHQIQETWQDADVVVLRELLDACRPGKGEPDVRNWEWYYLWSICNSISQKGPRQKNQAVSWSPDGRYIAAGLQDETDTYAPSHFAVFDANTGALIKKFEQPQSGRFAWSPDSTQLAVSMGIGNGNDDRIAIWSLASSKMKRSWSARGTGLQWMAWSPDGRHIASVQGSSYASQKLLGELTVWNAATSKLELTTPVASASAAWSRNGGQLVAAASNKSLQVWDTSAWNKETEISLPDASPDGNGLQVSLDPRGNTIAFYGHLFTPDNAANPTQLKFAAGPYNWSPDGNWLVARKWVGSLERRGVGHERYDAVVIRVPQCDTTYLLPFQQLTRGFDPQLAFSPSSTQVAVPDWLNTYLIYDLKRASHTLLLRPQRKKEWQSNANFVAEGTTAIAWSKSSRFIAGASYLGTVTIWDIEACESTENIEVAAKIISMSWGEEDQQIALATETGDVIVADVSQNKILRRVSGHKGKVNSVSWSCEAHQIASGGDDGVLRLWDAATGELVAQESGDGKAIASVCWNHKGNLLAAAKADGSIEIWDPAKKEQTARRFSGHDGHVRNVCWSPADSQLVSAGDDRTVKIWNVDDGNLRRTIAGSHKMTSVSWATSDRLAIGEEDGEVRVVDAETGFDVLQLNVPIPLALAASREVCWSPDGRKLAAILRFDDIKVWNAADAYGSETVSSQP